MALGLARLGLMLPGLAVRARGAARKRSHRARTAVLARWSAGQAVGTREARATVDREALAELPDVATDAGGGAAFRSRREARSAR